jgi:8-oxo-dGTP diphosphatase
MKPAYGADPDRYQFIPRVLLIITHEDRVLLIRRAQHKKLWPGKYNAPGGHVELGEDPYEAGRRELFEETGVQVETLQLRGMIVAETGLPGSGILVLVYQGMATAATLVGSDEGEPVWVHPDQLSELDMVSDTPHLFELTLNQPDFFYIYKTPTADSGEEVQVRLIPAAQV